MVNLRSPVLYASSLLKFVVTVSIMFPFVGIFPGVDTQPNFILLGILLLLVLIGFVKLEKMHVLLFLFTLVILYTHFLIFSPGGSLGYIIQYTLTAMTAFVVYFLMRHGVLYSTSLFFWFVAVVYILVALIQVFIPDFLAFAVSRSESHIELLKASGRGVRSLTGEPSHFGKMLIFLNILIIISYFKEDRTMNQFYMRALFIFAFFILCSAFFARSFYMLFYHIMLFSLFLLIFRFRHFVLFFVALFAGTVLLSGVVDRFTDIRIFYLLSVLYDNPQLLAEQGALRRALNIPASIIGGFIHTPYGFGNADARYSISIDLLLFTYELSISNRLFGGVFEIFLKMGILGTPVLLLIFLPGVGILMRNACSKTLESKLSTYGVVCAFILVSADGSLANPVIWFFLFFIYKECSAVKAQSRSGYAFRNDYV